MGVRRTALNNYRFFARLHAQLFPYIFTYAKQSATDGLPVIRPLVLLYQDDPQTHTLKHTYCFGNEFLVAPVIKPTASGAVTERVVYLPDGTWFDFWTQQRHSGGQEAVWRSADQQQFPLFVRAGAIIPMLLSVPDTLCSETTSTTPPPSAPTTICIFSSTRRAIEFHVHDDTVVSCREDPQATAVQLSSIARRIVVQIFTAQPHGVTLDGAALDKTATSAEFDAAQTAWWYDTGTGFAFVKCAHRGGR